MGAYLARAFYMNYGFNHELLSTMNIAALMILLAFLLFGFYFSYMNPKISSFLIEVESETRKVSWPEWMTVKGATGQVIVVMLFFLFYLFIVDIVFGYVRQVVL